MAEETTTVSEPTKEQTTANPLAEATKTETPADVMIPKARFDEVNTKLRKLEADAVTKATADQKAEEERLTQQAEWQKLADSRKAKVDELTPKAELADRLTDLVTAQYAAEIKDWPEQVRNMAPADEASILDKLAWANKARPLATELLKDKTPVPGNGSRPKVASPAGVAVQQEKQRESWATQANRRYR